MERKVTHSAIVEFHKQIAAAHIGINGFYRFNVAEIEGKFRSGVGKPALLLESHSAEMESSTKSVTNFNGRYISFMLLDFVKVNDFEGENEVLDRLENIGLDICAYLVEQHKKHGSWLFGLFDVNNFRMEKVGPIFDNMFGWNILYTIKNHESMKVDPEKWVWPVDSE
ncbi:hypothetical protein [Flavobacterium sp. 3HN19-14]|uniref:hypothetical protein n=1 Tax=Flavobacterium sp. 3HN19-14 TaxID=3448133 RepID=UPI003EE41DB9